MVNIVIPHTPLNNIHISTMSNFFHYAFFATNGTLFIMQ